jgi:hypothetical protein
MKICLMLAGLILASSTATLALAQRLKLLTNALAGQMEFWPPDRTVR